MKGREALAYCRQLLFEQKLVGLISTAERVKLASALARWVCYPGASAMMGTARLDAERQRWREEVEHERASALERVRKDARVLEQARARLDAAEGVVVQLRADNMSLRQELAEALQRLELGGELEELRTERSQRAAAGAKAVLQEAALRSRLEAEQKRLADGSAQLASLEAIAEEDQNVLRIRQTAEERAALGARDDAAAAFRAARSLGRGLGRLGWHAAYACARLKAVWNRHEAELLELDDRLGMLDGLRESRDALEWRVTQTKAQLIIMRSAAEGTHGAAAQVDAAFNLGHLGDKAVGHGAGAGPKTAPVPAPVLAPTPTPVLVQQPMRTPSLPSVPGPLVASAYATTSMPPPAHPPPGFVAPGKVSAEQR